jgi:tellurite methyltransferase
LQSFSPKPLPELTNLLDVRVELGGQYVVGASHIPFGELRSRLSELPASGEPLFIADLDGSASAAQEFLARGGREAQLLQKFHLSAEPQVFRLWRANRFLMSCVAELAPERAVDIGAGAGREAVSLAAGGWVVNAVDILADTRQRGETFAQRYGVGDRVFWSETPRMIESAKLMSALFFFDRAILVRAMQKLPSGATVIIEAFTELHWERFGKPRPDRFVRQHELPKLFPELTTISYTEGWQESGRHTAQLVGRRQ